MTSSSHALRGKNKVSYIPDPNCSAKLPRENKNNFKKQGKSYLTVFHFEIIIKKNKELYQKLLFLGLIFLLIHYFFLFSVSWLYLLESTPQPSQTTSPCFSHS